MADNYDQLINYIATGNSTGNSMIERKDIIQHMERYPLESHDIANILSDSKVDNISQSAIAYLRTIIDDDSTLVVMITGSKNWAMLQHVLRYRYNITYELILMVHNLIGDKYGSKLFDIRTGGCSSTIADCIHCNCDSPWN